MKDFSQIVWKEVAWNGIRFIAPDYWHVGIIGPYYLMLEEESGPVMEIKWGQIKGAFSHKAHLRRLVNSHGKQLGKSISECPFPAGWKKALGTYKAQAFSWEGNTICGKGTLLYCPTCQNATIIQFYQKNSSGTDNISQHILSSFRDHQPDRQVVWTIFDIRARIPDKFRLVRYRFEAGEFELVFKSGGQKINLHRWGPASVLLSDQDLVQFARKVLPITHGEPQPSTMAGHKAVEWEVSPLPTRWTLLWSLIKPKNSFQWSRIWHLEEKNRILGITAEGKRQFDHPSLERISACFESI